MVCKENSHETIWNRSDTFYLDDIYAYNRVISKLRYIKNDQVERWNKGNTIPYDFAKEKEWRFVPITSADLE